MDIQPRTDRPRVLVADDHPLNSKVAAIALRKAGCTVDIAENGRDAVQMALAGRYDVVFMDCHMPVMDGFAAAEEIRRHETEGRHTPIVAFTAHVSSQAWLHCQASGMDAFLGKPVTPNDLRRMVDLYVPAAVSSATADVEDEAAPAGEGLLQAFHGDRDLLADLAVVFARSAADLLGEIDAAETVGDLPRVASAAHTLAGAVGNLSRDEPYLAARRLMEAARAGDAVAAADACPTVREAVRRFLPVLFEAAGIVPPCEAPATAGCPARAS